LFHKSTDEKVNENYKISLKNQKIFETQRQKTSNLSLIDYTSIENNNENTEI
jgi:hypothetical protein